MVLLGCPSEFALELGGIDRVAEVMPGAVFYKRDLLGVGFAVGARPEFVEQTAEEANEVDVLAFVVAANVVGLADAAFGDDGVQGFGVVSDVEPVTDVFTFAVNRDGVAAQGLEDDDGDQFLRKLVGSVVVGAVGYQDREAVSVGPGAGEMVAGGLAGGIGRVRVVRCVFGEETGCTEAAVNFIGGDVEEAEAFAGRTGKFFVVCAGGLEESEGAYDVGLDKGTGAVYGAVHVAFGGEMHDPVGLELCEEFAYRGGIADVSMGKAIVWIAFQIGK